MDAWPELDRYMHQLADLGRMSALLSWDQQVLMPRRGAEGRARAVATLRVIRHRQLTDPRLGELLDEARGADLDVPRAAMVRVLAHDRDRAVKLPDDLVRRLALAGSRGQAVWEVARKNRDWELFRPCLEEIVALKREQADLLGHDGEAYDALMDGFEPGMRTARVEPLFASLADDLQTLLGAIADSGPPRQPLYTGRVFPDAVQWDFTMRLLRDIGFDLDAGRQDRSAHPFTTTIALHDIRLTTRMDESDPFSAISSTMHEAGHGLYDQGFDPEYEDTPIAEAPSLGLHESQSRLWENLVGRSAAVLAALHAGAARDVRRGRWADVTPEDVYREVNRVQPVADPRRGGRGDVQPAHPDPVRARARAACAAELEVADLPGEWNAAYERRLGVRPPHDGRRRAPGRPLVDRGRSATSRRTPSATCTRPSCGSGSRPTFRTSTRQLERAEFAPLLDWLRTRIHRPGYIQEGDDLIHEVTGSRLQHGPFMRYLWGKYGPLYGLEAPA